MSRTKRNRGLIPLLAAMALSLPAASARADSLVSASASLGWGSGVRSAIAWRLSAGGVAGRLTVRARASGVEEFEILGPSPAEYLRDYGVLAGVASNDHRTLRFAAVGLGVVRGLWRTEQRVPGFFGWTRSFEQREETAIGVPFELGAVRHGGHFGVGLTAFGNLNGARSYVAFALTVQVGRLR